MSRPAAQAKGVAVAWRSPVPRPLALGRNLRWSLCLVPSLVVLAVVTLAPALFLLVTSFTPLSLTRPETARDFSQPLVNYALLLQDGRFWNSVWVQAKLSAATVALQLAGGLALALLLNVRSAFLEACRTVFLIPMVLPPIVVAILWKVLYTPDISPIHWALEQAGGALACEPIRLSVASRTPGLAQWEGRRFHPSLTHALRLLPTEEMEAFFIARLRKRAAG